MAKLHSSTLAKHFLKSYHLYSNFNHPNIVHKINPFATILTQQRFYSPEPVRKFYGNVRVKKKEDGEGFVMKLDERNHRTPSRRIFETENEGLIHGVATEWAAQKDTIMLSTMHLTGISNTVQDNPHHKSKHDLVNDILELLPMDTIIYRSQDDPLLWEMQRDKWDPVLYWFQDEFGVKLPIVSGTILAPAIPDDTLIPVRKYILNHSFEAIQGLAFSVATIRSVILPLAVARRRITTEEAVQLSRLEIDFQTDTWGTVEWAHDLEYQDSLARVAAGMVIFDLHTKIPFIQEGVIVDDS